MDFQEEPLKKRSRSEETVLWEKERNDFTSKVNKSIYLDERTADVYFICGVGDEQERVPAHKCILSKSSPFFDAMFYGPLAEDSDKNYKKWSPDAFKDFLQLCYLDEITIGPKNITDVMKLAHESQMFESLKLCGEIWSINMTTDDVCRAYHWSIHFEMKEFKEFCERKISAYAKEVFETSDFLSCDRVVLNHILEIESLVCDEKMVLQACLNWASKCCERDGVKANEMKNLREYLKDLLYKVRYSSITPKEFREIMDSKVGYFFEVEDLEDIMRLTAGLRDLRTGHFNPNRRSSKLNWKGNRAIKYRLSNRTYICKKDGLKEITTFRSSRPLLLGGLHFASIAHTHYDDFNMKIIITQKSPKEKIVYAESKNSIKEGNESYFDLANNPIFILPEFFYEISCELSVEYGFTIGSFSSSPQEAIFKGRAFTSHFGQEINLNKETTVTLGGTHAIFRGLEFNLF